MVHLGGGWDELLGPEFEKPYYQKLRAFLKEEYTHYNIFPPMDKIFNALQSTPYDKVKAVILGQDPYHGAGQAHGLCFSVQKGVKPPPSLQNIFKELNSDIGMPLPPYGELTGWTKQGVLLLNTVLTVRAHQANSHRGIGWEEFTDAAIRVLDQQDRPMVFMLWGRPAQMKKAMLHNPKHLILEAPHPSPLSAFRGFFGSRPFSRTNEYLVKNGLEPIDWQIENITGQT